MTTEKIKELPPLLPNPPTPTEQAVEQTYQEGKVWEPNEPTTIEELMGRIPNDLSADVDTTCPFYGCLLEHRTSDNRFNYVKCPEYSFAFIASQQEVHQFLQAVDQQWHKHLVINTDKEDTKWL